MVTITDFSPREGWPGSLVEIHGTEFAADRDGNIVELGGARALVVDASPERLRVLAGPGTGQGPVSVMVGGQAAAGPADFVPLGPPDGGDLEQDGPPTFFEGPQRGTPRRGVRNQPVLVILCFPTDQDPGDAASRQSKKNAEETSFNDANRFWREASYDSTTWRFDFTDWLPLPRSRNYYIWQQEDIDDARRRFLGLTRRGIAVTGQTVLTGLLGSALIGSRVALVDTADPALPSVASRYPVSSPLPTGIALVGTRAYISTGSDGLHVVDVANPASPSRVAHLPLAAMYAEDVDANATVAVLAARENGIFIYDLTLSPPTPVPVSSIGFGAGQWATAVRLPEPAPT